MPEFDVRKLGQKDKAGRNRAEISTASVFLSRLSGSCSGFHGWIIILSRSCERSSLVLEVVT